MLRQPEMDKAYARPTARARDLRNSASYAERKLWQVIGVRELAAMCFSRQVPVGRLICDFMPRPIELIVKVDGGPHNKMVDRRRTRTLLLERQSYQSICFWNDDVLDILDSVPGEIERVIAVILSPNLFRGREGHDHAMCRPS